MKLVEMKCKNCGSMLKVEEGAKNVTCQFCHTTYVLDDEVQHVEYDNMEKSGYEFEKGRQKAQMENVEEFVKVTNSNFKAVNVIITIAALFIIIIAGLVCYNIFISFNSFSSRTQSSKIDILSFNGPLEIYSGTTGFLGVTEVLDEVITANKKNPTHQITVVHNDINTSNPDEILDEKLSIDKDSLYEISFDYNQEGYINKVTIIDLDKNN